MTVTAPIEPRRDAKGGFCGRCRNGQHTLCASPPGRCECPSRDHPNRPSAEAAARAGHEAAAPRRRASTPPTPAPAKLRKPVWELVKADPPLTPPKPKRLNVVEIARPFLEQLMAEDERSWHRIAVFPSSMSAGQNRGRLVKAYREFEFAAVRVPEISQSALYVRWLGTTPAGQL